MHCSDLEGTLAPLFKAVANMDFMGEYWVPGGFAHICVRGESLEGSCGISPSICSAMCKRDMENPKWFLQHPEPEELPWWIHPISISYLWWTPVSKPTETARRQMQLSALILLLFQQYRAEIAGKTKRDNNCYLCCHSYSASQGSLLKISWYKEHVSYSNWNADLWGWNTFPRNTISQ